MSRIILTTSYVSDPLKSPEEAWYAHFGDNVSAAFGIETKDGRWFELMSFTIPRPLTELVPDAQNPTGKGLKINIDWDTIQSYNFAPFIDCFPHKIVDYCNCTLSGRPTINQLEEQRKMQFAGWARLVAIHFATGQQKSLPSLESQAQFWEQYLFMEMCDFPWLLPRIRGAKTVIARPEDPRQFRNWQKIASCTAEILWAAPEAKSIFAAARVAPDIFPCLKAGFDEARKHGGIRI